MSGLEYIEEYLNYLQYTLKRDEKTVKAYRRNLKEFSKYMYDNNFTPEDLNKLTFPTIQQKWLVKKEDEGLKAQSLNQRIVALKAFLNYMQGMLLIERNAADSLKKYTLENKEKEILNIKDTIKLMKVTQDTFNNKKNYENCRNNLILNMLLATGMRISELQSINMNDINWNTGEFEIIGKRKKQRDIILNETVLKMYREFLEYRNQMEGKNDHKQALFLSRTRQRMSLQGIEDVIDKLIKNAEVPRVICHSFRHEWISLAINNNHNLEQIGKIAGHSNPNQITYGVYYHQDKNNIRKIMNDNILYKKIAE